MNSQQFLALVQKFSNVKTGGNCSSQACSQRHASSQSRGLLHRLSLSEIALLNIIESATIAFFFDRTKRYKKKTIKRSTEQRLDTCYGEISTHKNYQEANFGEHGSEVWGNETKEIIHPKFSILMSFYIISPSHEAIMFELICRYWFMHFL